MLSLKLSHNTYEYNSSDTGTFSFDQAAPAEAMEGTGESVDSSGVQSSPDTHVTCAHRSKSAKRPRPQIDDAERESRPVGGVKGGSAR